ncbi:HD domain-containing protein [Cordyceps fumosorosea ARSEF 2679]|uniref:HD domain-containing protein n=1 Tax=Cordyceps fumosorosea (strain ARSEF 2679) TaxID=1081104 RepID=A0A167R284_CORFA|nr:HD domain-containing protein [Cordyceps fumosorosea ARSEF 2679]OAA58203.1 HD domain-containing protein [Cordyceps fumosorosea ARSEF 2679]
MNASFLADFADDELVSLAALHSYDFMSKLDASHDWEHIVRVASLAARIYRRSIESGELTHETCSLRKIMLAALLHDVADRKYIQPDQDPKTVLFELLTSLGADHSLATDVGVICHGVSYTGEIRDPDAVAALALTHRELAVVQDADRLDAIGAVGIGRLFTYGGAKTTRPLQGSLKHFDEKLLHLVPLMKTGAGSEMGRERTERLRLFKQWWDEECSITNGV